MKRGLTLPVVALGRDKEGRPTRLSVPGLTRAAPIVSGGRRIGEVARDGTVTWSAPGSAESYREYIAHSDGLDQAAWARRRLRAVVVDGRVVAVSVPSRRREAP